MTYFALVFHTFMALAYKSGRLGEKLMLGEDDSEAPRLEAPCHVEPGTVGLPGRAATVPSPDRHAQGSLFLRAEL